MFSGGAVRDEPVVGSLCTGYGGLDEAVLAEFGGRLAWVADNDPDVSIQLATRYPGIPNLGDIALVDWAGGLESGAIDKPDIMCLGFPCQDVSLGNQTGREGIRPGTRSGVWAHCARAIGALRPELVIIENVRGICSAPAHSDVEHCPWCMGEAGRRALLRALGAVLGDLASIGFDAEWSGVQCSDAGGCHQRERIFVMAWPAPADPGRA